MTHNWMEKKMDFKRIEVKITEAIDSLYGKDHFLLEKDISERAISHKIAVYLNDKFPDFDVDCEYNGYERADNNKKYIMILHSRIEELGRLKDSDKDKELLKRSVYPDIIVHKRGKEQNLLIIEIKKEKNKDSEFDREKIKSYTSSDYENKLNYKFGALIIFSTGNKENSHEIEWYENGNIKQKSDK